MASNEVLTEEELEDLEKYNGATRRVNAIRRAVAEIREDRGLLTEAFIMLAGCETLHDMGLRQRMLIATGKSEEQIYQEHDE